MSKEEKIRRQFNRFIRRANYDQLSVDSQTTQYRTHGLSTWARSKNDLGTSELHKLFDRILRFAINIVSCTKLSYELLLILSSANSNGLKTHLGSKLYS